MKKFKIKHAPALPPVYFARKSLIKGIKYMRFASSLVWLKQIGLINQKMALPK